MYINYLGTVVATKDDPNPLEFQFVISDVDIRENIETGTFVQVHQNNELVIGIINTLRRTNRYFSSPDIIHGSSQGLTMQSIYPAERWDYIIAKVRTLGAYRDGILQRSTRPILPGSKVELVEDEILSQFLGLSKYGLNIGKIKQSNLNAKIDMDRLLQKHLAILSISGGGKSYATTVIIEEILKRPASQGRPAVVIFDVHGEYRGLDTLSSSYLFRDVNISRYSANSIKMATGYLHASDFGRMFPSMSYAQKRELSKAIATLKSKNKPITVDSIINLIYNSEINLLVKDALLGWLSQLKSTYLFSNVEMPDLRKIIRPGSLIIFDLSDMTSLWIKQIVVHYYLTRLFELRRNKEIPPVISFLEEAHQFAPETESSTSKSIIHTIAREGRKFLCSLVLISQRPVNLSTTALSQCNSHLILRILNPHDLNYIGKTSEGINQETLGMLTTLGVGEGLLVGSAVNYPVFLQIRKKIAVADYDDTSLSEESKRYEQIELVENKI